MGTMRKIGIVPMGPAIKVIDFRVIREWGLNGHAGVWTRSVK